MLNLKELAHEQKTPQAHIEFLMARYSYSVDRKMAHGIALPHSAMAYKNVKAQKKTALSMQKRLLRTGI